MDAKDFSSIVLVSEANDRPSCVMHYPSIMFLFFPLTAVVMLCYF